MLILSFKPSQSDYRRLAEETCLTRRRVAALYLHAARGAPYLAVFLLSLIGAIFLVVYERREAGRGLPSPPSSQAIPYIDESRTLRGYPRRYIVHKVKSGDSYYQLAQLYYGDLQNILTQPVGKDKPAWQVIQDANATPDQAPFIPQHIPVIVELKIPLP